MPYQTPFTRRHFRALLLLLASASLGACFGDGSKATVTEQTPVFDDAYWAALAQSYPPFVPEPNIGQAQSPEDLINEGRWGDVIAWPEIATGAANLPDGRIMTWSSTGESNFSGGNTFTHGSIYDPNTNLFTPKDNQVHNTFCAGVSLLPDGEIFAAGGGATITTTSIYADDQWSLIDDMQRPRWYATSTVLATGQVLTSMGDKFQPYPELWTPNQGWELRTNLSMQSILDDTTGVNGQRHWYPALNVAPDGTLFHPGPTSQLFSLDLSAVDGVIPHGSRESVDQHRLYNTTVMYDIGKMLVAGGGTPARASALLIDVNSATPAVTAANPMNLPRSMHNSIVLPNGKVLVIGGNSSGVQFSDDGTQLVPEIWDPDTGVWDTLAPHAVPRNYHSTALLLKDGRVAVMGGGLCGGCATNHQDGEIFEPPYLFNADGSPAARPNISAGVSSAVAGDTVTLNGTDDMVEFNMVRLVALTHHHTTDQRLVPVPFQKPSTGNYQLAIPANPNVVLPGNYWVFGLNADGVPSTGHTINIGVSEPLSTTEVEDTNAVSYEYFEGSWNVLPDFDALTPTATGNLNSFNVAAAQRDDNFGMRFNATLSVPADGLYTFYTTSDDGSQLFIDDQLVVDNNGVHPPVEKQGAVNLTAGEHQIVVTFFEKGGGQVLAVQWAGPGIAKQDVTNSLVSQASEPAEPAPELANLLANADFEQGTSDWLSCSDNPVLEISNNSFAGTNALQLEGCTYTEFPVTAGERYDISCAANGNGAGYASITFAFNDDDFVQQGSQELPVTTSDYQTYGTNMLAPPTSTTAALVFYAENGNALFDDCKVNISGDEPAEPVEPTDPTDPTDPSEPEGNLIINSTFEQNQSGWFQCSTTSTIARSGDAASGAQALAVQGCAFSEFAVNAGQTYRLYCDAKANGSDYASITLSYSDTNYNPLASQEIPLVSAGYQLYTLELNAPPNSIHGALDLYAEGSAALFDNCFVVPAPALAQ